MYCPRCSHEQGLEEMRFCSRCGFALAGVAQLLENPGIVPKPAGQPTQAPKQRSCMIKESLVLTIVTWAIALTGTLLWDVGGKFESVAKVGTLVFFILGFVGLMRFLFAFLFVKDAIQSPLQSALPGNSYAQAVPPGSTRSVLPPAHSVPTTDYSPRGTREIVSPPSVTENTTRLLEDPTLNVPTIRR